MFQINCNDAFLWAVSVPSTTLLGQQFFWFSSGSIHHRTNSLLRWWLVAQAILDEGYELPEPAELRRTMRQCSLRGRMGEYDEFRGAQQG